MNRDINNDPPRDPELARWLDALHPVPPVGAEQMDALATRIRERALLPLARLRRRERWWDHAARWARPAVPLAVAAAIAFAILLPAPVATGAAGSQQGEVAEMEEVLRGPLAQTEWDALMLGAEPVSTDALLRAAVLYP